MSYWRSLLNKDATGIRSFVLMLVVAASIRGASLWSAHASLAQDPDSYALLAEDLANYGGFGFIDPVTDSPVPSSANGPVDGASQRFRPTAFRPFLYPWMLSWLVIDGNLNRSAVAFFHWMLGVVTVLIAFQLARRLTSRAWLVGVAVALDPLLVRQSQLVMTETLATFLAVVIWWGWNRLVPDSCVSIQVGESRGSPHNGVQKWGAWGLGIGFGLAILARPTAAPWYGLCCVYLLWIGLRNGNIQKQIFRIGFLSLGMALCVGPWMARNYRWFGQGIWATTHGGYTLLLANNPSLYQHFAQVGGSRDWDATAFHDRWARRAAAPFSPAEKDYWESDLWLTDFPQQGSSQVGFEEIRDNRVAYESALATIKRQPILFLRSCVYRVAWLWAPWPHGKGLVEKLLVGGWYSVWFLLASVGFYKIIRWSDATSAFAKWVPGLLLILSLTLVHAVYWSNMRMRAPCMPAIYLLGAYATQKRQSNSSECSE